MWRLHTGFLTRWFGGWLDVHRRPLQVAPLLLVILASVSGCGATSSARGTASTNLQSTPSRGVMPPISTPLVPPANPLTWSAGKLPQGFVTAVGVAQSDGATAYVCAPTMSNTLTLVVATWVTHDRGIMWQRVADFTLDSTRIKIDGLNVNGPITVTGCQMLVDPAQANTAIAQPVFVPTHGCSPQITCYGYAQYATTDGGGQWNLLQSPLFAPASPGKDPLNDLLMFGSHEGVTYALFETTPQAQSFMSGLDRVVLISHDDLRTWTPMASTAGFLINGLWVNPYTDSLLLVSLSNAFSISNDGGAHWSVAAQPPFLFSKVAVQQPFTDQPWRICGADPSATTGTGQPNPNIDTLACSSDGGVHWSMRRLNVPNDLNRGAQYILVGIADDGAVLLTTPSGLERVGDGVNRMQLLGYLPTGNVLLYAAGSGSGTLWSIARRSDSSSSELQGPIFTASYA